MIPSAYSRAIASPSSIACRRELALEWAANGDPRAELIAIQLRQYDGDIGAATEDLSNREFRLLRKHGREWAAGVTTYVDEPKYGFDFRLGLVSGISLPASEFARVGRELTSLAPIIRLTLRGPVDVAAIANESLDRVRVLELVDADVDDRAVSSLAHSPHSSSLRGLSLARGRITDVGLQDLRHSRTLSHLIYADLTGNPCVATERADDIVRLEEGYNYHWDAQFLIGPAGKAWIDLAFKNQDEAYSPLHWPPRLDAIGFDPPPDRWDIPSQRDERR